LNCDQDWLHEVFGEFGEFVQGTIQRPHDADAFNYALVSFRKESDVTALLENAVQTVVKPSHPILKKRKKPGTEEEEEEEEEQEQRQEQEWKILMETASIGRNIGKPSDSSVEGSEVKLWLSKFDSTVAGSGGSDSSALLETYDEAVAMARTVMTDLHLFLAIERGYNLPATDRGRSGDPFCQASFTEKPVKPAHKRYRANPEDFDSGRLPPCLSWCSFNNKAADGLLASGMASSKKVLGRTRVESEHWDNPSWLWSLDESSPHKVAGIGKRGWLMIHALDEDILDDELVGEIQINLDKIPQDELIEGWYAIAPGESAPHDEVCIGETGARGCIKIRMLLSSFPDLADKTNSWLLDDHSFLQIYKAADGLQNSMLQTTNSPEVRCDRERLRQQRADHARLLWRLDTVIDAAFQHIDINRDGELQARELGWMMKALGEKLSEVELAGMIAECKSWGLPSQKHIRRMKKRLRSGDDLDFVDSLSGLDLTSDDDITYEVQFEMSRRLLKEWSDSCQTSAITNTASSSSQQGGSSGKEAQAQSVKRDAAVLMDLQSRHCSLSRAEFKTMLTDYWVSRKEHLLAERRRRKAFLMTVELFQPLEDFERAQVANAMVEVDYSPGDEIITEGDTDRALFFLHVGVVDVYKNGERVFSYSKMGDCFGERAMMDSSPRAATIRARTDAVCLRLDRNDLEDVIDLKKLVRIQRENSSGSIDQSLGHRTPRARKSLSGTSSGGKIGSAQRARGRAGQQHIIEVTREAGGLDSLLSESSRCHHCSWCSRCCSSNDDENGAMQVPDWLFDIGQGYTAISKELREPEAFWETLGGRMQQVVLHAQGKGIAATGESNAASNREQRAQEAAYAMKAWHIRSIGSPDGLTKPSTFSVCWDLMQVILLLWVLVSVPFGIAFMETEHETTDFLFWWELWVDLYFVFDILLNFRTPYYLFGELFYSSSEMAKHYFRTWFIPDVLSCTSMIQYVTLFQEIYGGDGETATSATGDNDAAAARLAKLVRLVKLAKLLRLARAKRALARLSDYAYEHVGGNMLITLGAVGSVLKLVSGFMLAMHLVSCVYYMLGDVSDGWVPVVFPVGSEPVVERYFQSMMTVALGSFLDETKPVEEVFAIFSVLFNGCVGYSIHMNGCIALPYASHPAVFSHSSP
jgi:Ca2+-binding EF-hand superfamily protein